MSNYEENGWKDLDPLQAIETALTEVSALSKGKRWQMCIPPQNEDSDIVISGALKAAQSYIEDLKESVITDAIIQQQRDAMWEYLKDILPPCPGCDAGFLDGVGMCEKCNGLGFIIPED